MIDVCLLGTGGMMPLPYRALTSLVVRYNGHEMLIDCGEGTQTSMRQQGMIGFKQIDVICFTHFHADHKRIAGAAAHDRQCRENGATSYGWPKET